MTGIRYAQCWEDPETLTNALQINREDDVVSIGSAGDNSFALLLNQPRSLTIVDMNPAQLFLTELKMRSIQTLDYDDFVGFVGAQPCRYRERLYALLRASLTENSRRYWDLKPEAIRQGIIHCGKFEKYFAFFRKYILPLVHSQAEVRAILSLSDTAQQVSFYEEVWNNRRWRWLFQIFFGKFLLGHLGRDPAFFAHVRLKSVADELLGRIRGALGDLPIRENYFLEYVLTGEYRDLETAHPYLRQANFPRLKEAAASIRLVEGNLQGYLKTLTPRSVSKFNLSDIFEYMSPASFESALREILRVGLDRARLAYWTLFVPRFVPPTLTDKIDINEAESKELFAHDRTFFYGDFHAWHCGVLTTRNGFDENPWQPER